MIKKATIKSLLAVLVFFVVVLVFYSQHLYNSDDGVVLSGAWRIWNGEKIYIDFFEFVPPGVFYCLVFLWKIFGVSYWSVKLLSMMILTLSAFGIWKLCSFYSNKNINILPPILFIILLARGPVITYHVYNIFFTIWAVYFFIFGYEKKSKFYIILSSIFCGLSIVFLVHKGLIFLFGMLSFLFILYLLKRQKILFKYLLWYIIIPPIPFLFLFIFWPPSVLWENIFIFPLFNYTEVVNLSPVLVLFFVFLVIVLFILFKNQKSFFINFLLYLQLVLLITALPSPDSYHVNIVLFPILSLLPLIINKIENQRKEIKFLYFSLLVVLFLLFTINSWLKVYNSPPFYSVRNEELFNKMQTLCQNAEYIYAGPFFPELYFELRKMNPTPYSWLITNHHTKEQFLDAKDHLEANLPGCVILNYYNVLKYKYNIDNPVDNFFKKNYQLVLKYKKFNIYKK